MGTEFHQRYQNVSREGFSAEQLGKTEVGRLRMIEELIPISVHKILDVGCGEGIITNPLFRIGKDILGIDISITSLKYIESKKIQSSIERLPFKENTFDLVLSSSVLEHLPHDLLAQTAHELMRVSREYILVSTPYKEILWKSLTKCPRCGSMYHANLHLHSFDENSLIKLFPSYKAEKIVYGELKEGKSKYLIWFSQHVFNQFAYSASAIICPVCGLPFSKNILPNHHYQKSVSIKVTAGRTINTLLNKISRHRGLQPTHLAILLQK